MADTTSKINYSEVGLKCGLEIHQQLDTGKLFCRCPSVLRSDKPEVIIKRKLHAVPGESGEVDIAAKHEMEKEREFIYEGYYDNCCLVEYDESPPLDINTEALKIALHISLLLNAKIFPITQIMRKTVIDGSNTTGFQRTVLIARDGYVETVAGRVGIESICLEEDSARIIGKKEKVAIYRLDRLGIPLIEIATAPDIKTPQQAKEVALHIGEILRSCKVKRGLGTIRQDVNMSIKKGCRVEIKGVQDPELIVKVIDSEIERQLKIINEGKVPRQEVRKALPSGKTEFLRPMPGAARMYPETDLLLLKISRETINEAKKTLPKLKADIEKELSRMGLNNEMIKTIFKQKKLEEFKELLSIINSPVTVAKTLLIIPKEIAAKKNIPMEKAEKIFNKDVVSYILENVKSKKISENDIKEVMERVAEGTPVKEAVKIEKADISEIEEKIMKIIKDKPGLTANAYMGLVMKELGLKGKISGKDAMEIIKKFMNN